MNILFFADPNSIHDIKWIEAIADKKKDTVFILPREIHYKYSELKDISILKPIPDFSIVRFYRTIRAAFRIRNIIKKNKISIIHILYAEPNVLWCLFKKLFRIPMVVSCRGTDVLKTIPEAIKRKTLINHLVAPAYRLSFQMADWVSGTSQRQIDSVIKFSGRSNKVSVIRTGIDIQRLASDTTKHFPLKDGGSYILFPRFIKPIYNHEFCLRAINQLPSEIKKEYTMVFVGKDSGDLSYQSRLAEEMDSMHDVKFVFLPKVSQEAIFELYKRASLVVMTPFSDGSPVSAIEAIASGSQVILGPVEYDKFFKGIAWQLTAWSESELINLIISVLKKGNKKVVDLNSFLSLVDRKTEMDKVYHIYMELL